MGSAAWQTTRNAWSSCTRSSPCGQWLNTSEGDACGRCAYAKLQEMQALERAAQARGRGKGGKGTAPGAASSGGRGGATGVGARGGAASIDHRAQNKAELAAATANVSWKHRPQDAAGMSTGMSTAHDRAALRLGPLGDLPPAPLPAAPRSAPAPLTAEQRQQQKEQAAAQAAVQADALRQKMEQKARERRPLEEQYQMARTFLADADAELVHALEVLARPEVAAAQALVDTHAWNDMPLVERIRREQKLLREVQPDQPHARAEAQRQPQVQAAE